MCRRDTGRTNNFLFIRRLKDSGSYPASPCNPRFGLAVRTKRGAGNRGARRNGARGRCRTSTRRSRRMGRQARRRQRAHSQHLARGSARLAHRDDESPTTTQLPDDRTATVTGRIFLWGRLTDVIGPRRRPCRAIDGPGPPGASGPPLASDAPGAPGQGPETAARPAAPSSAPSPPFRRRPASFAARLQPSAGGWNGPPGPFRYSLPGSGDRRPGRTGCLGKRTEDMTAPPRHGGLPRGEPRVRPRAPMRGSFSPHSRIEGWTDRTGRRVG